MKFSRFSLIFFFTISLSLGLTGFSLAQDKTTLTVSVEAWMVDKYNMPELEKRFEANHPDVDVVVLTHEGNGVAYPGIFLEWSQTGKSTADLYFGGLVSQIAPAIIDDQLIPLDGILTDELAPDKWIPGFLSASYVEGAEGSHYPTLPGLGETINFQFNTNLFTQAGFADADAKPILPTTYEQIHDYACALAKLETNSQKIIGFEGEYNNNFAPDTWMAAVVAAEGTYLTKDGKINWDSEAGKKWLAFQKQIVDEGCGGTTVFTDNNGARNALKAGQAAIINASNSRSSEGTNALCKEQGTVPCPSGDIIQMFSYPGDGGTIAFSHQFYIPRVAAHADLALAFAREAILSEYAQTWSATQFGKMPTLWANYDALPKDANVDFIRTELEGPTMGQWQFRDGQFLRNSYVEQLQLYLTGDQTLDETIAALKSIQDGADLTVPGAKKP
ncbi:MAG: hypothetical protein ABI970_01990 [Chloroflexota bacterium]